MLKINQNNPIVKRKLSIICMFIALDLLTMLRLSNYAGQIAIGKLKDPILKTILNHFFPMSSGTTLEVVQIMLKSIQIGFKLIFLVHIIIYSLFYLEKKFSKGYLKIYAYYSIICVFTGLLLQEWVYLIYLPIYILILSFIRQLNTTNENSVPESLSAKEESNLEA